MQSKLFLTFLLCLIPFALSAQRTISGRITDAEDGSPLQGAHVFISYTTVGTTTDADGYYHLKIPGEGSYRLTVSYVGYQPAFKDIEPGKASEIFDIAMEIATIEDVIISKRVRYRKADIDLFWRVILGEKPSKRIQPLNPEAVHYYFDSSTGILKVTCRVPLQIVNLETGYQFHYVLHYFTHDYRKDITVWEGECMFAELEPKTLNQKKTWDKNRKYIYSVSIANFIKSLYNNTLTESGFLLVWEQKYNYRYVEKISGTHGIMSTTFLFHDAEGTTHERVDSKYFLFTDTVNDRKMFYAPSDLNVMLICFG